MPSPRPGGLRGRLPWRRLSRRRTIGAGVVVVLLAGLVAWVARPATAGHTTESRFITVRTGPDGTTPVTLDTTYYRPASASAAHPAAAVLLAHGFGGTKDSVAADAADLADRGYAVLAWTAEGFGRSGGQVHVDSPDWEVRDAQRLIDWLAARPEVMRDAAGDPRVAAVGGSYGGALALLLAGYDRRVDAIVPEITWNDLAGAFLPESTGAGPGQGVFKRAWAGLFFGGASSAALPPAGRPSVAAASVDPSCGRFAADACAAYLSIATTGRATPEQVALLRRSSPATILDRIAAPTLLVQGQADSLFPLSEADANARGIAATGTPVRVAWYTGGHDGGTGPQSDQDRLRFLTAQWLDHYLLGRGSPPGDGFTYSRIAGLDATSGSGFVALGYQVAHYPGIAGQSTTTVAVLGPPQPAANPPNGTPAALSSLPGVAGGLAGVAGVAHDVAGQHADFVSAPLAATVDVVGAPRLRVRAASPTGEAVLFVKLYDVDPRSGATLPDGLVAPVHLTGLPASVADARPVAVTLPAIVHEFQSGHLLLVTVATSDQAYATPAVPAVYVVAVDPEVSLPTVRAEPIPSPDLVWRWVLAALVAALAAGTGVPTTRWSRRTRTRRW
jgi:ABC-2 type transport system ATP-binding protein